MAVASKLHPTVSGCCLWATECKKLPTWPFMEKVASAALECAGGPPACSRLWAVLQGLSETWPPTASPGHPHCGASAPSPSSRQHDQPAPAPVPQGLTPVLRGGRRRVDLLICHLKSFKIKMQSTQIYSFKVFTPVVFSISTQYFIRMESYRMWLREWPFHLASMSLKFIRIMPSISTSFLFYG